MYDFNLMFFFYESFILLFMAYSEHKNNYDDEFTDDACTFLGMVLLSESDTSFSGIPKILISNIF